MSSGVSEAGEPCKVPECSGRYAEYDCGCSWHCESCEFAFKCDKCGNLQRYLRKRLCDRCGTYVYGNNRAMKRHFLKCQGRQHAQTTE